MTMARTLAMLASGLALALSVPASADVKAGVDAWARGDYDRAVSEWRGPAAKGDPDAQFNMAQAYRLGRGVDANEKQAEVYYAKAAAQGHIKAADNYGLLLFQGGRREEAMPYVTAAADRGDPRAQYLLGIAHFNGDLVGKDWVRAYALLTLSNSAGLPQAAPAIKQMDDFIPLDQREQAQALAQQLKRQSDARRSQQLAAVDLAMGAGETSEAPAPAPRQVVAAPVRTLPARGATRIPEPIPTTRVPPSVAAAQAAIAEAARVTGTESPADAGADFAGVSRQPARATPSQSQSPVQRAQASDPQRGGAASASGPWRVQLGAFGVRGNADKLWSSVASNSALAGKEKFLVPAGRLTKLQAGGFASRGAAQNACNSLKRSGQACLVTR